MVSVAAGVVSAVAASGGLVGWAAAYVAWRHRDHPAAVPFAKQSALASTWGLAFAALVFVRDPGLAAVLFGVTGALGFLTVNYFLQFTVVYTGRGNWLTRRRRRALAAIYGTGALVTFAGAVTGLFGRDVTIRTVNGLTLPVAEQTVAIRLLTLVVAYPAVLAGVGLLGSFLVSQRNVYRRQTAVIGGAVLFTAFGSVLFRSGLSLHPGLDLTPVFYAVEAVAVAGALFYYDFLDVEPLAPAIVLREVEDPVFVLDERGRILQTNPAAESLFDETSPVGRDLTAVLPGLLAAADAGREYEHERATGEATAVYDLRRTAIRDQYDRERGSVVVLRDVTLQKRREETLEELQSVNQRFLAAESRDEVIRIAVEAAERVLGYRYSGGMLVTDEGDGLRMAALTDSLFDAYAAVDVGGPTREVRRLDGGETAEMPVVPRSDGDVWQVLESGEPMLGEPITAGGDRTLPVSLGGTLLFPVGDHGVLGISSGPDYGEFSDDDRRFARILAAATENALDRVAKEEQLRESRALLERRKEQIQFFNSVLRHDLLNGMTVVRARAELLHDHVDDAGREHVAVIENYTDDIVTLTQKVRSVTEAITGEHEPDLHPVDLRQAIEEKVTKLRDSHANVTIETAVDERRVPGDDLLPEVIENLVLNAIEHNDSDTPRVTIRTHRGDGEVRVRIADNGPGVPESLSDAVFEKRVTSEDSGSIGFGLYFVDAMMDRYGGDVWFEGDDATATADTAADLTEPDGAVAVLSFPTDHPLARH